MPFFAHLNIDSDDLFSDPVIKKKKNGIFSFISLEIMFARCIASYWKWRKGEKKYLNWVEQWEAANA